MKFVPGTGCGILDIWNWIIEDRTIKLDWKRAVAKTHFYNSSLTSEQFLFYEIRIAAKFYIDGKAIEETIGIIKKDNLFQYPTERKVSRMARACYKRLDALDNGRLVHEIAFAPNETAKQINLYAIMRYNRLAWEFMVQVIGEKFQNQDFSFSKKDLNAFFSRLQAQDDSVAAWNENTISKIKSVFVRMLIETEYLDGIKDTTLHTVFLCEELEQGIKENNDYNVLPAFNYFR